MKIYESFKEVERFADRAMERSSNLEAYLTLYMDERHVDMVRARHHSIVIREDLVDKLLLQSEISEKLIDDLLNDNLKRHCNNNGWHLECLGV